MAKDFFDIDYSKMNKDLGTITVDISPDEREKLQASNAEIKNDKEDKEDKKEEEVNKEKTNKTFTVDFNTEQNTDKKQKEESTKDKEDHISPLIPALKDEGILIDFNEEEYNKLAEPRERASFVIDSINNKIKNTIDEQLKQYGPVVKDILNRLEYGVNYDDAINIHSLKKGLEAINEDDIKDDVDIQKKLVRELYKITTSFDDKKIDKLIKSKEEKEELADEAKEAYGELSKTYDQILEDQVKKAKYENDKIKENQKNYTEKLKTYIDDLKEIVPGLTLTKSEKDSLYKNMTIPVRFDTNGNAISKVADIFMKDPQGVNLKFLYLSDLGVFDKDSPKWDKLLKAKKRDAVDLLAKVLDEKKHESSGRPYIEGQDKKNVDVLKGFPM